MTRRKKRILGNDRALMFLCRDARRRWMQYGENRKEAKAQERCNDCLQAPSTEYDHVVPLGPRPRITHSFGDWLESLFYSKCQGLCKKCHDKKTKNERRIRNEKS